MQYVHVMGASIHITDLPDWTDSPTAEQKRTADLSPAIFWISQSHAQTQIKHPSQHLAYKDNKYMAATGADN